MADIDVFNGDADGICALTQLRLAEPRASRLITGVKRDIELLDRVQARAGDRVTVLDISFDKNRAAVDRLLHSNAVLLYVDHHFSGDVPRAENLTTIINEAPDVCTSMLVSGYLGNRWPEWAIVGAFGDNLRKSASLMATRLHLDAAQLRQLEELGIYMNYNGYGEQIEDLHFAPETLYRLVSEHSTPFEFISQGREHFQRLADGYHSDISKANSTTAQPGSTDEAALLILPGEPWARRISGVYSNDLANLHPNRAHAVLMEKTGSGHFLVSVRAPLNRKRGADELCRRFASGGGRAAAAGINDLPADRFDDFARQFFEQFASHAGIN